MPYIIYEFFYISPLVDEITMCPVFQFRQKDNNKIYVFKLSMIDINDKVDGWVINHIDMLRVVREIQLNKLVE